MNNELNIHKLKFLQLSQVKARKVKLIKIEYQEILMNSK